MTLTAELFDVIYDCALDNPHWKSSFGSEGVIYQFGDISIEIEVRLSLYGEGHNIFRRENWEVIVGRSPSFHACSKWFTEILEVHGDAEEILADLLAVRLWMS
jgi:hypothetical protein